MASFNTILVGACGRHTIYQTRLYVEPDYILKFIATNRMSGKDLYDESESEVHF